MSTITEQILDAVENAEPVIIHFVEGHPGNRTLYANVIVPHNYYTDENGGHRIPDAETTSASVMNRLGDWTRVEYASVAKIECV